MPLTEGHVFAGYTILRSVGSGGMGEVYLVQHPRLPRHEALKVLPADLTNDDEYRDRFDREAAIVAALWHPHIVALHDRGEFNGQLWITMDYVEGTDAARLLEDNVHGLAPDEVVRIVTGVAEALDYAHDNQMFHRDVKPANILVAQSNSGPTRALLSDFGIARRADDPGTLTATNMTVGTISYAAPEQLMGYRLDGRADQYALAATAFHLLSGSPPFQHANPAVVISQHLTAPPPAIDDRVPELAVFGPIFTKALAKSPEDRYNRCLDFARALAHQLGAIGGQACSGEPTVRSKIAGPRHARRKRQVRWSVVAPTILAVFAISVSAVTAAAVVGHRNTSVTNSAVTDPPVTDSAVAAPLGPVPSIAATVPDDIRATGRLVIGVKVPYAPNEFKNSAGELVGFDVDLMNAAARTLGLVPDYRETEFDSILPTVAGGKLNVGMSSVTDTKDRESMVDFVTYFRAGTLWAQRSGSHIDPNAACGHTVGAAEGSTHAALISAKSDACVAAGLPPIRAVVYSGQDSLTAALIAGEVDAMSADSPVTGFAVKLSAGALEPAGEVFDSASYGWPVAKGSALAESLRQAMEHLIRTGEYRTIATMWGVDKGMIDAPVINGAIE
jgi:ABC-type amino acid transport substrate-binding protein